eukprot:TRINITY_DN384_c0_g2_i1.p1 TRINITY_DN384_c0_g2~~TRINITY_DN384_c0_g2_i1.p1  ORF type:complete len:229 (+),score=60.80 TRINITY_DN384_c0_g2_i1:55-687(+)
MGTLPPKILIASLLCLMAIIAKTTATYPNLYFVFKPFGLAGLIYIVHNHEASPVQFFILLALLLSSVGDIALLLKDDVSFLVGLTAFLLAHLSYMYAFAVGGAVIEPSLINFVFILSALNVTYFIRPKKLPVQMGVIVYSFVIHVMAMLAFDLAAKNPEWYEVQIASVMFLFSDATLAWNRFNSKLPMADVLILGLYYGAQILFVHDLTN